MTAWPGRSGRAASACWGWGRPGETGRDIIIIGKDKGRAPLFLQHNKGDGGGDDERGAQGVLCACGMGGNEGHWSLHSQHALHVQQGWEGDAE